MRRLNLALVIFVLFFLTTPAHAFLVTYTDFSAWKLAVNNIYREITDLPGVSGSTLAAGELVDLEHAGDLAFVEDLQVLETAGGGFLQTGGNSISGSFNGTGASAFGMNIASNAGENTVTIILDDGTEIVREVDNGGFIGWAGDDPVNKFEIEGEGDGGITIGNIVEASGAAPEPLSATLLGLGLSGLIFSRRRKSLDLKKSTKEGR